MANDLVEPVQLSEYPGAPFDELVVDAAVATVRRIAGWHIALEREETVTVDSRGGTLLYLPTRYLTDVTEVRDLTGDTPRVVTGWRASIKGKLSLGCCGWPSGLGALEVDIVHGYPACPPELLPIIAGYCLAATTDQDVSQESLGSWSTTYRDPGGEDGDDSSDDVPAALAALSLPWGAA